MELTSFRRPASSSSGSLITTKRNKIIKTKISYKLIQYVELLQPDVAHN
jgi:hypothetical protein